MSVTVSTLPGACLATYVLTPAGPEQVRWRGKQHSSPTNADWRSRRTNWPPTFLVRRELASWAAFRQCKSRLEGIATTNCNCSRDELTPESAQPHRVLQYFEILQNGSHAISVQSTDPSPRQPCITCLNARAVSCTPWMARMADRPATKRNDRHQRKRKPWRPSLHQGLLYKLRQQQMQQA